MPTEGSLVPNILTHRWRLLRLVQKGLLEKVDAGLYYRPRASRMVSFMRLNWGSLKTYPWHTDVLNH